ncbi:hypothetical protein D9M68_597220 [compost metagenome]
MPRAMRDTPISTPIGTAVATASPNAPNTRTMLAVKCSVSGWPPCRLPCQASMKAVTIDSGVGRNSGGSQRRWLAIHHSASRLTTVMVEMRELDPSPGRR